MSDEAEKPTGLTTLVTITDEELDLENALIQEEHPYGEEKHMGSSDYYWNSYAHFGIHEEMLKDDVRTRAYRNAIKDNPHLFKDKLVLDIGCGTGILSLFAVQAGAKHVYAIDNSSIIEQAKQIAKANKMDDRITFIRAIVEETELPVPGVDVIISEWMGYFLFYESMLNTVLWARDKWLNPGGILLPDQCSLSVVGIEDQDYKEDKINWWNNVWGFKMPCIRELVMLEPLVDVVDEKSIVTSHCMVLNVDLATVKKEELTFRAPFRLKATRSDYVHALVAYFDMWFTPCHKVVHFSTGPHAKYTHWKQTVFYLNDVLYMNEGEELIGVLHAGPNSKNPRDIDIKIHYKFSGEYGQCNAQQPFYLR